MPTYADYEDRIAMLVEILGLYDGWSIAVLTDGTLVNRWANDDGTAAAEGYERRYAATEKYIVERRAELLSFKNGR